MGATASYTERVNAVRHQLGKQGLNFKQWAQDHGYSINQVYTVTRRKDVSKYGISREIAEKLGLTTGEPS